MVEKTLAPPVADTVLEIDGLSVVYESGAQPVRAVAEVSFALRRGEMLGLVGESGSGKTTAAMAVLGLVKPPGRIEAGRIVLNGVDLLRLDRDELRRRRWRAISLIPQGAMNALNPVMRVGAQLADVIRVHEGRQDRARLRERILELFEAVGLPERVHRLYPHELSGGMKQRVCIAMAIALRPDVVVADEPTSALDVVVQRAVAEALQRVQDELGMSVLLIGHDMALQAQLVDRVGVMCRGRLVEIGPVRSVFHEPVHPYTQLLLAAVPSIREASWSPPAAAPALRAEAEALVARAHPLREHAPDHLVALP
jgi:ABC-type glutathione transport system ATPase component